MRTFLGEFVQQVIFMRFHHMTRSVFLWGAGGGVGVGVIDRRTKGTSTWVMQACKSYVG